MWVGVQVCIWVRDSVINVTLLCVWYEWRDFTIIINHHLQWPFYGAATAHTHLSKVTDFQLSHKDKDYPNNLDLSKDKEYDCIDNKDNPSRLQLYTRRDKAKKKGIKDILHWYWGVASVHRSLWKDRYVCLSVFLVFIVIIQHHT